MEVTYIRLSASLASILGAVVVHAFPQCWGGWIVGCVIVFMTAIWDAFQV